MLSLALLITLAAPPAVGVPSLPPSAVPAPNPSEPVLRQGVLSGPRQGDLVAVAREYVVAHAVDLGLSPRSTLGEARTFGTRFGGSVHLPQLFDGVPLHGASAIVTFDGQGRIVRVASSLSPTTLVRLEQAIDTARARAVAAGAVADALLQPSGEPAGGVSARAFSVGGEVHRGYWVWVPTLSARENWHVAVDATDGAVLFAENRVHRAFDADVFNPSAPAVGPVATAQRQRVTLTDLAADAGTLTGNRIKVWGCCPTAGCQMGAPAKRATGSFLTGQGTLPYDMAICDRRQTASSDPATHTSGNFVYAPVDPPTSARPSYASAADWDSFSEVMGYFHVTRVYDRFQDLSRGPLALDAGTFSPFVQRDNAGGHPFAVWVNASEPDLQTATRTTAGIVSNDLSRVSNAMFLPREQMDSVSVPENAFDTDALVIYQSDQADFSYDGPVLWHEFGHGLVYSTSDWDSVVTFDERSANNESSALHEGVADVIAFMTGNESAIGTYIAARTQSESALRNAANTFACPDVLQGESHADSQHFSGALWEARSGPFRGMDDGRTFDAAFYAALVSFPKNVGFTSAATIISHAVGLAFPGMANAEQVMLDVFRGRGVVGCSKVLDLTDRLRIPRTYYGVSGTIASGLTQGALVPGPHQFKLRLPHGAKTLAFTAQMLSFGNNVGVRLLTKAGRPITFTRTNSTVTSDAELTVTPTVPTQGQVQASTPVNVECGGELYFTLANTSGRDRLLASLSFTFEERDTCPADAGVAPQDAGTMSSQDAGNGAPPQPVSLGLAPDALGTVPPCGCSAAPLPMLGLLALALRRRSGATRRR